MKIDVLMPIMLSAEMGWDYESAEMPCQRVILYFGRKRLTVLEPIRESRAGHGDDSSYFESEERSIVEETVAAWLKEKWAL